ncbi:MAG TPA: hypothetical protein VHL58_16905 [Thermoanaerobaculia bacterium]|nr:hypothetical protein [Thermoanaerobaculia bacterium]
MKADAAPRASRRVFLGLSDICGYYSQLERGLIANGVECTLVNAFPSGGNYNRETRPDLGGRIVEWLGKQRAALPRGGIRRLGWKLTQAVALLLYLLGTLPRYSVYVFASGESFLMGADLPLLRLFRKRIIVVFHGSDSRPPYINAAVTGTEGPVDANALAGATRRTKARVRRIERSAQVMIDHTLSGHFHERAFINWFQIGIPYEKSLAVAPEAVSRGKDEPYRIAHAPTRPGPKGTAAIERAVANLQNRGFRVELTKIVGRPNREVLEAIAASDFVVDELYSDSPMASFATEAAVLGKPSIVGMYGFEKLQSYCPASTIPPSYLCHAESVEKAIETLLTDEGLRRDLAQRARHFVETHWSPVEVGRRFRRLIEDDIPPEWWFEPGRIDYLHGWGLTEERLRFVVGKLVEAGGVSALQLGDKPALERAFLNLIATGSADA